MSVSSHNVYDLFRKTVEAVRDHPALVWSEREVITFGELDRLSHQVAVSLQRHGVRKGDRVCIRLEKCTLAYALILACLLLCPAAHPGTQKQ